MLGCGVESSEIIEAEQVAATGVDSKRSILTDSVSIGRVPTIELSFGVSCYGAGLYGNKTA